MSNFIRAVDIDSTTLLEFGVISEEAINVFTCQDGETAAWQIVQLETGPDGLPLFISMIYDNSSGAPVLKGSTWALKGMDLTKGLFSSGCFPTNDPLAIDCKFYKVDY